MPQDHDQSLQARALVMLGPLQLPIAKVSRELGVSYDTLWKWRRDLRSGRLTVPKEQVDAALGLSPRAGARAR